MKLVEKNEKMRTFLALHLSLFVCSFSGVCSKMAGKQDTLAGFVFWYGGVLAIMAIYAIAWQQILKKIPLTVAYSNKAITFLWSAIWGALIFKEKISLAMVIGAMIIFAGIYLVVTSDE